MAEKKVNNGNVLLIDPMNTVSDLPEYLNGTPNYEEMFIFVSLRTRRRRRSVIRFDAGSTSLLESQISDTNVNMLGYDTDSGNFTTKWSENESNTGTILEGFGITSINIKTNSSYIPQVNIEFTDIKGLAFFNKGSQSPYQALFDFPPPIFDLTVKGYYGKSLTYQLHLVRHSTEFQSEIGNFTISAEFIARTFAPLTDVPFKYVDILPLIKQETRPPADPKTQEQITDGDGEIDTQRQTPNIKLPPKTTHEFIIKLKRLYDGITTIKESSQESTDLDNAEQKLAEIESNISLLNNFKNILEGEQLQKNASIIIGSKNPPEGLEKPTLQRINKVEDYNQKIQSLKTDGNSTSRIKATPENGNNDNNNGVNSNLYLAIEITGNTNSNQLNLINQNFLSSAIDNVNLRKAQVSLNQNFKSRLISDAKISINESQDLKAEPQLNHLTTRDANGNITTPTFVALDITGYYIKLNDEKEIALKRRNSARLILQGKISNTVNETLGFLPTIYNVFKILCDDIDTFFNILRKTNVDAENHHQKFSNLIFSNQSIKQERVSSFPLYVSGTTGKCNVQRNVRQYPITLSNQVRNSGGEPFPEITLVDDYINAFIKLQKELLVNDLRSQEDAQGNNKWIPVTPFDSELLSNIFGKRESPYNDIEFQYSNNGTDIITNKYLNKIIERYYVLSQYTFGRSFYSEEDDFLKRYSTENDYDNQRLIEIYATGEAYNLAVSLTNQDAINNLKRIADDLSSANIQRISQELSKAPAYNRVSSGGLNSKYITIGNNIDPTVIDYEDENDENLGVNSSIFKLYKDRNSDNYNNSDIQLYKGFEIIRGAAVIRTANGGDPQNSIDKYIALLDDSIINDILNFFNLNDRPVVFTKENLIYATDIENGNDYRTKYIAGYNRGTSQESSTRKNIPDFFESKNIILATNSDNSFTDVLSDTLTKNNTYNELIEFFTGSTYTSLTDSSTFKEAKAFLFASNFLKARSVYDRFSLDVQQSKQVNSSFLFPSVIEVPYFTVLYMGGLAKYSNTGNTAFRLEVDGLINKFVLPTVIADGSSRGLFKGNSDIALFNLDVIYTNQLMLDNDKNKLIKIFNDFVDYEYTDFERSYIRLIRNVVTNQELIKEINELRNQNILNLLGASIDLYDQAIESIRGVPLNRFEVRIKEYFTNELLNGSRDSVVEKLFEPYIFVVPSEFSFYIPEFNNDGNAIFDSLETRLFQPLSVTNAETINGNSTKTKAQINESYFKKFFSTLASELVAQKVIINNIDKQANDSINDNDIKGTLYYSFKSISDKWIAGLGSDINKGFPLNEGNGDSLIDKFMFVDRAMNPIGTECIIDVEPLLELVNDFDVNMFSVMSTLLSHNGFEFFPLQNFMSFKDNEWEDSFKIIPNLDQEAKPAFVCMYIGGSASQLNNDSSEYEDDGIIDIGNGDFTDFKGKCIDENDVETNTNQPYSQVRAFRVRFAEQNQSYFTNIKLEGREFTETNDSLAILSKIAGDESNTSPVAKGQNLFNVYENRAYSAKVKMFGNMMIQPTQYFQLENIPMYSGAYIILDVEHTITPNNIMTEFQGTKILKYPNPFINENNYAVNIGYQSGTAEDLSGNVTLNDVSLSQFREEAENSGFADALRSESRLKSFIDKNNTYIDTLHPQVRSEFARLFRLWENEGYFLQINSAFRSKQQQANVTEKDANGNPIARPGRSFHQYGLAIDVSLRRLDANKKPIAEIYLKNENPYWEFKENNPPTNTPFISNKSIAQIAEENGFRWGGRFTNDDDVHFEKPLGYGYFTNDISKRPIYNGTFPKYDEVGTLDDLIKRFDKGLVLEGYVIFDERAKNFIKNRY